MYCNWIEGDRTFCILFGAITASACLAVAIPTLWWVLPHRKVWLFRQDADASQGFQIAYGVFAMAMAWANAGCRFIPHGPLPWVHPAFFVTTLLIVALLGPRVAYLLHREWRAGGIEGT